MKRLATFIFLLSWVGCSFALSLRPDAPSHYVVKSGDTLWDIAHTFLEKPWEWEELWKNNPQLPDPDHIYPGTVIDMRNVNGKSYLSMSGRGTRVLVPTAQKQPLLNPIPPLELSLVRPFISQNQVYSQDLLKNAPYVVGFSDQHLISSDGDHIYVKDLRGHPNENFAIFREDGRFYDVKHRAILGYNAAYIGNALMVKPGNPSTLVIDASKNRVEIGDRIMPIPRENNSLYFYPHPPRCKLTTAIIHIVEGIAIAGSNQIVVLDKGRAEGMDSGSVLAIVDEGDLVVDPVYHDHRVKLPNEQIGELMVFRAFDHVSYALVMESLRPAHIGDLASNPH